MNLELTDQEKIFRDDARSFFKDHLPDPIRQRTKKLPSYVTKDDMFEWQQILFRKGWVAPNWPLQFGGTGWSLTQKFIFEEEYQAAGAPRLSPFGLTMVGPVIYTFGTNHQKARFLPKILSGEEFWCQGYSEPDAGSDLASLKTRAIQKGNHYIVNGHKIWTSHAHHADLIFCLVRTDQNTHIKQEGISFLLIDMTTPGITVRPIIAIDGGHYLNEVFFENVRVPIENLIGKENQGWTYAKFLLGHERTGIANVSKSKKKLERLHRIIETKKRDTWFLQNNSDFETKIANVEIRLMTLEYANLRALASIQTGKHPGAMSSALKVLGTQIEQDLNELLVESIDYQAFPYPEKSFPVQTNEKPVVQKEFVGLVKENLLRRAASIYGGSNEIQKNIIAKAILDM